MNVPTIMFMVATVRDHGHLSKRLIGVYKFAFDCLISTWLRILDYRLSRFYFLLYLKETLDLPCIYVIRQPINIKNDNPFIE